ncbi:uncharacterized protein [Tenebrio molitor]|uniref:uncharacterized protein isoform X2 n=1 Tax=Tenebrio molitor TaxID=7067 RepID=UPI0036249638
MRKFFRYAYEGYAPVPYAVNPVRWLEALLCIICLALAVYLTVSMPFMHLVFKVILVVTAGAFTAITIIDIISNTFRNPIYWNTWTLFAITAALFFFLCVGLLIATGLQILLIIAIVFNAITAIVFLLDAFLVLKAFQRRKSVVHPKPAQVIYEQRPEQCYCVQRAGDPESVMVVPEAESTEVTIEKRYEVARSVREGNRTVEEIEEERTIQRTSSAIIPKQRTTTSYGGTFPMSRDAMPLPSPDPQYRSAQPNRRRVSTTDSRMAKGYSTNRIYRDSDGKMYTENGTSLMELQSESGQTIYQEPDGVTYGRIPSNELAGASDLQEVYTYDGKKVNRVYGRPDRKLVTPEGAPLYEVRTENAPNVFEGSDGVFYSYDAPSGRNTSRSEIRLYEDAPRPGDPCRCSPNQTRGSVVQRDARGRIVLPDGTPVTVTTTASGETLYETPNGELLRKDLQPVEIIKVTTNPPLQMSNPPLQMCPVDCRRKAVTPQPQKRCTPPTTQRSEIFRTTELTKTIETERPDTGPDSQLCPKRCSKIRRGADGRLYLPDGAPLNESRSVTGEITYEGPGGEMYTADGLQIISATEERKTAETTKTFSSRPSPRKEREYITVRKLNKSPMYDSSDDSCACVDRSPRYKKEVESPRKMQKPVMSRSPPPRNPSKEGKPFEMAVSSRTVAISTRMVPKSRSQKSLSAPGSPDSREPVTRNVKSAEAPNVSYQYQQQTPSVVYHQYVQKPCHCGKVHYQTATTVHGTVCAASCPFYIQPKESQPQKLTETPSNAPCGDPVCPYGTPAKEPPATTSSAVCGDPKCPYTSPGVCGDPKCPYTSSVTQNVPCNSSSCQYYVQSQTTSQPKSVDQSGACAPNCPYYQDASPRQPVKVEPTCTPQTPCGKKDCPCCSCLKREDQGVLQQELFEPGDKLSPPLQTISECECETDPSSIWGEQGNGAETPSDVSSSQPTSSDHTPEQVTSASCDKCYVCGDKTCSINKSKSIETDEVQTSETRMIRAVDIQRMNLNLPGSADNYDK